MKIAIVHDYFIQLGGAEKVAEELRRCFPGSDLVTTVDIHGLGATTSWLQKLPITEKNNRLFFMLYPLGVETLDLTDYDLIISSTSGYAKGVRKRPDAVHICYCHTPMRWCWRYDSYSARENFGPVAKRLLPPLLWLLKRWDFRAARRPDHYIANSRTVANRIKECYGRDSIVIPPPIDTARFSLSESSGGEYYLVLSRLAHYKRLDLAVEACRRLGRKLVVIGDGPARSQLEAIAGPETTFLGRRPDEEVAAYVAGCKALIFPGEEDFGMVPLEVNSAGKPVIAYRAGGALETVVENTTGVFFAQQEPTSLMSAIADLESREWDPAAIHSHALEFSCDVFAGRIREYVAGVISATPATDAGRLINQPEMTTRSAT